MDFYLLASSLMDIKMLANFHPIPSSIITECDNPQPFILGGFPVLDAFWILFTSSFLLHIPRDLDTPRCVGQRDTSMLCSC